MLGQRCAGQFHRHRDPGGNDHADAHRLAVDFDRAGEELSEEPFEPGGYLTDYWTEEALDVIEANKNRPFFLYLAYTAPHWPLHAHPEDIARYEGRTYVFRFADGVEMYHGGGRSGVRDVRNPGRGDTVGGVAETELAMGVASPAPERLVGADRQREPVATAMCVKPYSRISSAVMALSK